MSHYETTRRCGDPYAVAVLQQRSSFYIEADMVCLRRSYTMLLRYLQNT